MVYYTNMSVKKSANRKLAIIMITTHGTLIPLEDKIKHDGEITVRKINATSPGVCNWTSPGDLNEMIGQRMNRYITNIKKREELKCLANGVAYNPDNIICLHGTDKQQQGQIRDFSKLLRTFMPTIDDVHKDTKEHIEKKAQGKPSDFFKYNFGKEDHNDPDMLNFIKHLPTSYRLEKWLTKKYEYYDKIYTIHRTELVGEDVSAINNTIFFLGEPRLRQFPLPELPVISQTRSSIKKDNIEFRLSDILKKIKDLGYTDTIIIDLSCNAGDDERDGRRLRREYVIRRAEVMRRAAVTGGKRKTRKYQKNPKSTRKQRKK